MSTVARTKNATNEDFHGPSTTHQTVLTRTALPAAQPSLRASRFQGRSLPIQAFSTVRRRRRPHAKEYSVVKKAVKKKRELFPGTSPASPRSLVLPLSCPLRNKDSCVPCRNLNLLPFRGDECVFSPAYENRRCKKGTRLSHAAVHKRTSPVS